jgi:hypothetical protein
MRLSVCGTAILMLSKVYRMRLHPIPLISTTYRAVLLVSCLHGCMALPRLSRGKPLFRRSLRRQARLQPCAMARTSPPAAGSDAPGASGDARAVLADGNRSLVLTLTLAPTLRRAQGLGAVALDPVQAIGLAGVLIAAARRRLGGLLLAREGGIILMMPGENAISAARQAEQMRQRLGCGWDELIVAGAARRPPSTAAAGGCRGSRLRAGG